MTLDRWLEIKSILEEALDLTSSKEINIFLNSRCPEELRAEVEAYLTIEEQEVAYLDAPVFDILAARNPQRREGEIVGRTFRLEAEIGHGAMGVVYRASRIRGDFDLRVAIKILKRGCDTREFIRRFRRERQILAGLLDPNIPRLIDGGATEDGLPYLVMELVDGMALDEYCEYRQLSLEQRLVLIQSLCQTVQKAHSLLVVHCDLKPSNILVTSEGQPKVLDFGIARALQAEGSERHYTKSFGTPPYASPEQCKGGSVTTGSDIFALGALLYQLVAGSPPAVDRRPKEAPIQLNEIGRQIPFSLDLETSTRFGELDAIIRKATAWDVENRYSSAAELASDIGRFLRQEPIHARSYRRREEFLLFLKRHRNETYIVLVASILIVLLSIFGVNAWLIGKSQKDRADASLSAYRDVLDVLDPDSDESIQERVTTAAERFKSLSAVKDPRDRAKILDRLGHLLFDLGSETQGLTLLTEAMGIRQELLDSSKDLEDYAASLNNVALVEKKLRRLDRAADLFQRSLTIYTNHPNLERAEYFDVLNNLAEVKVELGPLAEAERLHRRALEGRKKLFDEHSKQVKESYSNLGQTLARQNKFAEAEPMLEKVFRLRFRRLGPDHERTLLSHYALSTLWHKAGKLDQAVEGHRTVLAGRLRRSAPRQDRLARSRLALAMSLIKRGSANDLLEAGPLLEQAEGYFEAVTPSVSLWLTRQQKGAHRLAIGDLEEAESILRENRNAPWSPSNAYRHFTTLSLLGLSLADQGRVGEALPLLESATNELRRLRGADSPEARAAEFRHRSVLARPSHQPSAATPYPPASAASEDHSAPQRTENTPVSQNESSSLHLQGSPASRDEVGEKSGLDRPGPVP